MKTLKFYETADGKVPFKDWLESVKDKSLQGKINTRLNFLALGYMPDFDHVGEGVFETRIHTGGGVRIYFYPHKNTMVVLLCGGLKKTQKKDIQKAIEYANDFRGRYE
ncbi:type II toxin-antitoxin system RelE/ParE family toxin [Candidatus Avelusimicrobium fimicolum]|uniref:type II toxin-antitoxin system RelE/ParE family toxin n=1 Tax=Candidatus Avelusimicrobium fimicolum TaxID=3416216 RepID=UPI003D09EC80